MILIIIDPEGKIIGHRNLSEDDPFIDEYKKTERLIESDIIIDGNIFYANDEGKFIERPNFEIEKSNRTISNIPEGTTLKIADQEFIINDGTAELSDNVTEVTLSLWPYIDEVITFED